MTLNAEPKMSTDTGGMIHPPVDVNQATPAPASHQTIFHEGQVLDNTYRIVRLIGEGGMGMVYEATHARLAGRYAIKVVQQGLSGSPEALARFDREARITSWLQHPNIVQVIDFNRLPDGTEYLVMEYLHGESLAERLRRLGAFPLDTVGNIVDQIAAALGTAHAHRILHRDLKPDNVFLLPVEGSTNELVKVLDFGISKVHDSTQAFRGPQSGLMGTPQYMAPEQCRGQGAAPNGASDQFALAVITFEMITGRGPFIDAGDSVGNVLSRVLYEDTPPMGIDPGIERVVQRGLAKAPQDRFPSIVTYAQALRGAISAYLESHTPNPFARREVVTVDALDEHVRLNRRWPWAVGATLAGMAVAVVIGNLDMGRGLLHRPPLGVIANVPRPPGPPAPVAVVQSPAPKAARVEPTPARPAATVPVPVTAPARSPQPDPVIAATAPKPRLVASNRRPRASASASRPGRAYFAPARLQPSPAPARVAPKRTSSPSASRAELQFDDEVLPLSFDSPP